MARECYVLEDKFKVTVNKKKYFCTVKLSHQGMHLFNDLEKLWCLIKFKDVSGCKLEENQTKFAAFSVFTYSTMQKKRTRTEFKFEVTKNHSHEENLHKLRIWKSSIVSLCRGGEVVLGE